MTICPECRSGLLTPSTREEVFPFDTGSVVLTIRADDVPVKTCDHCGLVVSGPDAATIRENAIRQAMSRT